MFAVTMSIIAATALVEADEFSNSLSSELVNNLCCTFKKYNLFKFN